MRGVEGRWDNDLRLGGCQKDEVKEDFHKYGENSTQVKRYKAIQETSWKLLLYSDL